MELSVAAGGLDSVAAPSCVNPCMFMAVPAEKLSFTRPSELASSFAADSTPLESEKTSALPSIDADMEATVAAGVAAFTRIEIDLLQA